MKTIKSIGIGAAVFTLAACGGSEADVDQMIADMQAEQTANALSFDDGYDVCFQKARETLGDDAMVSKLTTLFSSGEEIDSLETQPRGMMKQCKVEYQDPNDPKKMLSISYDSKEGTFSEPQQLEITVVGGDPADFNVADYVVRFGDVNTDAVEAFLKSQEAELGTAYGDYAWGSFNLDGPGMMDRDHKLSVSVKGRLASNDVKDTGTAQLKLDGKTVIKNNLMP